jgi:hypothetical protein
MYCEEVQPYSFKPELSLREAVVAVIAGLLRILFGSLLFAVCGAFALMTWKASHNMFWRIAATVGFAAIFLLCLALTLWAIAAALKQQRMAPSSSGPGARAGSH